MFRDIKGANILVDPHGRVKVADFGMAKHVWICSLQFCAVVCIILIQIHEQNADNCSIWSVIIQGKPVLDGT